MSESRAHVDRRSSFYPSAGPQGAASGKDLFMKALLAGASGDIEPRRLLDRLPDQINPVLEALARARYNKSRDALTAQEWRVIFSMLHDWIVQTDGARPEPVSTVGVSAGRSAGQVQASGPSRSRFMLAAVALAVFTAGGLALWRWLA